MKTASIISFLILFYTNTAAQSNIETGPNGITIKGGNEDSLSNPFEGQIIYDTSSFQDVIKIYSDDKWNDFVLNEDDHILKKRELFLEIDEIAIGGQLPYSFGLGFGSHDKQGNFRSQYMYQSLLDDEHIFVLDNDNPEMPFVINDFDVGIGRVVPDNKLHILVDRQNDGMLIQSTDTVKVVSLRLKNSSSKGADFQLITTGTGATLGEDRFIIRDAQRQKNRLIIDSSGLIKVGNLELINNGEFESYYNVGPESFTSIDPVLFEWKINVNGASYGSLDSLEPHNTTPMAVAPIHLSDQAIVDRLTTYTYDSTDQATCILQMLRQNIITQELQIMAATNTNSTIIDDDGLYQLSDNTVNHNVIDNENYRYFLRLLAGPNDRIRLYTAQLRYFARRLH